MNKTGFGVMIPQKCFTAVTRLNKSLESSATDVANSSIGNPRIACKEKILLPLKQLDKAHLNSRSGHAQFE
jgi:hypothetical protein